MYPLTVGIISPRVVPRTKGEVFIARLMACLSSLAPVDSAGVE
jgi:hypothetical protein